MASKYVNQGNVPTTNPAFSSSLKRLHKFPLEPRVPASKRNNITFSPTASSTPSARARASQSSPASINNSINNTDSINNVLTDAIIVSKSLADQVSKFDAILRRLEQGYNAMQLRVAKIEEEATESKQRHQLLKSRVSLLEEENARLFDRVNALCESGVNAAAAITQPPDETSPTPAKLQAEIDRLKQSHRNSEIILSGTHIENRIKNELERNRIPLRPLCIDIIAKIPGLEDCDRHIEHCVKLDGDHLKLLIKLYSEFYRGKIFACFFNMRHRKPFYINENLIPSRATFFHELRMLKKTKKNFIHKTFTKRGEIYYCMHDSKNTFHNLTQETLASLKEIAGTFENNN